MARGVSCGSTTEETCVAITASSHNRRAQAAKEPNGRPCSRASGVFEPEDIAIISAAYYAALADLGLSDQEDAVTLLVARRVIELASEGERDPARLRAAILASVRR
jgi:hypothetical protein